MPIARNTVPANGIAEINISGNFVYLIDSTGDLGIILDDQNEEFLTKSTGYKTKDGQPFKRINLINNTGVAITFNLQIGNIKDFIDNRSIVNGLLTVKNGVNDFEHAPITVGTTPVVISAANSIKTKVSIQNTGTSTLFLGKDNTVSTTNGYPVPPNTEKEINGTMAVWGRRATLSEEVRTLTEEFI
jgi:hypothetical protein